MMYNWNSWRRKQSLELFCSLMSIISALAYTEIKNNLLISRILHNISALICNLNNVQTQLNNTDDESQIESCSHSRSQKYVQIILFVTSIQHHYEQYTADHTAANKLNRRLIMAHAYCTLHTE